MPNPARGCATPSQDVDTAVWFEDPVLNQIRHDPIGANNHLLATSSSNSAVQAATMLVQRALQNWGCERLDQDLLEGTTPDGVLGPKSKSAIRTFQRGKGLTADGIIGPRTLAELDMTIGQVTPRPPGPEPDPNPPPPGPEPDPNPSPPGPEPEPTPIAKRPKVKIDPIGDPDEIADYGLHRVPYRSSQLVRVQVSNVDQTHGPKIYLGTKRGRNDGRVTLNSAFGRIEVKPGSQEVRLGGNQQTKPNTKLGLRLIATRGDTGEVVKQSPPIAVSSWPSSIAVPDVKRVINQVHKDSTGTKHAYWGADFTMKAACETGQDSDCDEVELNEDIMNSETWKSAIFQVPTPSAKLVPFDETNVDHNGIVLTSNDPQVDVWKAAALSLDREERDPSIEPQVRFQQIIRFRDRRCSLPATGVGYSGNPGLFPIVPDSGFELQYWGHNPNKIVPAPMMNVVEFTPDWALNVRRSPTSVTVSGSSEAVGAAPTSKIKVNVPIEPK